VLPHGVLHLHGAVVMRIRKATWQVTTPHDAVVHQLEMIADGDADAALINWLRVLTVEQVNVASLASLASLSCIVACASRRGAADIAWRREQTRGDV
jgi:hypothetical protein